MALERAEAIKGECVQIFVKNNMQWFGRAPAAAEVERFVEERKRRKLASVFGHTGYLINLGAPASENRSRKSWTSMFNRGPMQNWTLGCSFTMWPITTIILYQCEQS